MGKENSEAQASVQSREFDNNWSCWRTKIVIWAIMMALIGTIIQVSKKENRQDIWAIHSADRKKDSDKSGDNSSENPSNQVTVHATNPEPVTMTEEEMQAEDARLQERINAIRLKVQAVQDKIRDATRKHKANLADMESILNNNEINATTKELFNQAYKTSTNLRSQLKSLELEKEAQARLLEEVKQKYMDLQSIKSHTMMIERLEQP